MKSKSPGEEMTRLLPDLFKSRDLLDSEESVMIPDVRIVLNPIEGNGDSQIISPEEYEEEQARVQLQTEEELARVRQEAAEQAYHDAIVEKRGQIRDCISQVEQTLNALQDLQEQFFQEYAGKLTDLALDIAEKIMLKRIEEDDMALRDLVAHVAGSVKSSDWISVEVSDRLSNLVFWLRDELAKPEYDGTDLSARPVPIDTCKVHTPEGTLDASITTQIENLRGYFQDFR